MFRSALVGAGVCVMALLACKQEKRDAPSTEPVTSAPARAPDPAPPAPASPAEEAAPPPRKAATRVLTQDEISALRKRMAGGTKVFAEQSFQVEFDDLGECSFISALAPNERELVFFVFRNGKVYNGLVTHEKLKGWMPGKVNAVAFRDVDGDGTKDIVVVAEYMTGVGQAGSRMNPSAIVFMRRGANFKLDEARSERASAAGNDVLRAAALAR